MKTCTRCNLPLEKSRPNSKFCRACDTYYRILRKTESNLIELFDEEINDLQQILERLKKERSRLTN